MRRCRLPLADMEMTWGLQRQRSLTWTGWSRDWQLKLMLLKDRYEEKYSGSILWKYCNCDNDLININNYTVYLYLACQSGGPDCRGRRAWRTCCKGCQIPHQRIGRGPAKSQTRHGSPNQRIPGSDECQIGSGHWDCHLQEIARGRRGQIGKWHQGYQHLPTEL